MAELLSQETARMSRRGLLRAGVLSAIGIAGLQALACAPASTGSTSSTGPASGDKQPKAGGTLNIAYTGPFNSLDPHNGGSFLHIPTLVFNGILGYKNDLAKQNELEGDLAESWQQNDEKTYTFKVATGAKWQDLKPTNGRDVTSEDLKYHFERITKPNDPLKIYRDLYPYEKLETPDKSTLKVTLKSPFAPFLSYVGLPYALVIPKELDDMVGGKPLTNDAVGSGPFILKEYNSTAAATLVKNPNYWKKGLPYIDGIEYVVMADHGAMFNALRTQRLDATPQAQGGSLLTPEVAIIEASHKDTITIQRAPSLLWPAIRYNVSKPPFDNLKVRKALSLAIDRNVMLKTLWDGRGKLNGPLPNALDKWALPQDEILKHELYKQDLTKAKQLLSEAGYPNGFKTDAPTSAIGGGGPNIDAALMIKDFWSKIGVETTIRPLENVPWTDEMSKGNFDWAVYAHSGFFDPDDYFITFLTSTGSRNYGKVKDPKVDELANKQRVTTNEVDRKKVVDELQRYLMDQVYFTYLYSYEWQMAYQNYVKNYVQNSIPWASHRHWDVLWLDK